MKKRGLEKILKALANRRRLAILGQLKLREMKVGDVAKALHLAFKTTSRNLVTLERAGIVDKTQKRREVHYRISSAPKKFVKAIVDEL